MQKGYGEIYIDMCMNLSVELTSGIQFRRMTRPSGVIHLSGIHHASSERPQEARAGV